MAAFSVGEVEAAIRLRDAVSPTVESVKKAMSGGVGVTVQYSAAQQRAAMAMAGLHDEALKMNASLGTSTSKAGAFADSFGRTSTVLARSADVIGINAGAFRAMDDAADIAELGLNNLSKSAVGLNASTLGVAAAGFSVGFMLGGLIRQLPGVAAAADAVAASLHKMFTGIDPSKATEGLKAWQKEIGAGADKLRGMRIEGAGGLEGVVASTRKARDEAKLLKDATAAAGMAIKNVDEARRILRLEEDHNKAAKAAEAHKEKIRALALEYVALGKEAEQVFERMLVDQNRAMGEGLLKSSTDALAAVPADGFGSVNVSSRDMLSAVARQESLAKATKDTGKAMAQAAKDTLSFGDSLKGAFAKVPDIIMGALQGGGDLGKSLGGLFGGSIFGADSALVKNLTSGLTGTLGKTIGGALGSLVPGLGTLLGGLAGGLVDKIGGLFGGDKAIMEVNDLRDAFFDAHGGFVEVQKSLAGLTDQDLVKKVFDAKTVEDFNAAVSEVNTLLGSQQEAEKALEDAVKRYGFTIEELGPKFQQQQLHEQALALFQDFQLLKASGIDTGLIFEKMGPDLQNLVDNARATGQALPEAMKPMIDDLIKTGQLLDENGEAFTSAEDAGISFAKTLEEGLQGAIDAIDRLVAALTGIPTALPDVPGAGGGAPPPSNSERIPGFADGGFVPARPGGHIVRVGEGGEGEFITPASQMARGITFGNIVVQGASSPAETAKAVVQAIRDNIGGLRTELDYAAAGR